MASNTSWGEGFGIPIIEAMSCGVPAVVTDASSMPELAGPGWRVQGERKWNATHNARWVAPAIGGIFEAYEEAYQLWATNRERWQTICVQARSHAQKYDIDRVFTHFWRPALDALFRGRTLQHEADGYKWLIDIDVPTSDGLGASHEAPIEQVVLSLIPRGGVFLDVGAHVGHYSIRASRIASKVIAIEPNPDTAQRLRENIALNDIGNITLLQIAAWDEGAALSLFSPNNARRDGSTRVLPQEGEVMVQGRPLDAPLGHEERIDVIKLDVEGADLHALRGMRKLIAKHRPVLFIEDHSIYDYYKKEDLAQLVVDLGYAWTDTSAEGFGNYLICRPL
jgi:FkbM family methyltransferase